MVESKRKKYQKRKKKLLELTLWTLVALIGIVCFLAGVLVGSIL